MGADWYVIECEHMIRITLMMVFGGFQLLDTSNQHEKMCGRQLWLIRANKACIDWWGYVGSVVLLLIHDKLWARFFLLLKVAFN